ncbi:hypothetical protein PGH07_02245 [Sulfurovum sp. zt1-1]|uniref:Uncharacterized protein n=1 Tax=Sulfurovum zhangzhouensis TaxID=3019067 RepID=A0ABT7QVX5_9BACT|nr:hypothetical protein [Sulfurovum zhangzhouensis]MDM5270992.1 hypothetical protein [Sulfurovum zhangzhouensis]
MSKLFIINIIVGSLYGFLLYPMIWVFSDFGGLGFTGQLITGLFFSIPLMVIMWIETVKMNNKSILLLGGPLLSVSTALNVFHFAALIGEEPSSTLYKAIPYVLAYILFFSLLQSFMYDTRNQNKT